MRTSKVICKVMVLVFCFMIMTGFNYIRNGGIDFGKISLYTMYVNDIEVGTVKSAAKGLKLYDEVMDDIWDRYGDQNINIEADIYFKEIQTDFSLPTDEKSLKKALEKAVVIYTDAYAIVVDGSDVCYLKTQQEAVQVLDSIKLPYIQEVEDMENTELDKAEFKETVNIQQKAVLHYSIVDVEKAKRIITTGAEDIEEYEVKEGDTLWNIARQNDMRVEEILAANPDINSDTIKPGQKIKLQSVKTLITTVTVKRRFTQKPYRMKRLRKKAKTCTKEKRK